MINKKFFSYMIDASSFGTRLFLFVAGMPQETRRLFNRFLFKEAKEIADGRDFHCKRNLIRQLYNYFDTEVVTEFLFSGEHKNALEAYKKLPFDTFYDQYSSYMDVEWCNKTYDTFDSPTIFDANPEALKELDIADYQQLFAIVQERAEGNEPQDFSKIGYLSFFYKSELSGEDYAMVNQMYCEGELLYDMFDFICDEELATVVRKRAVDSLLEYVDVCGDKAFAQWVSGILHNYSKMNPNKKLPMGPMSNVKSDEVEIMSNVRLLPKSCLQGCDRNRFIAALEEVLTRDGLIVAGRGKLDSLFEGTEEELQPVIWSKSSYEFAFFIRSLCIHLERKEEIAARLFYYNAETELFKVSSLRSPHPKDSISLEARMKGIINEAIMRSKVL